MASVASLGLLHLRILSLKAVPLKGAGQRAQAGVDREALRSLADLSGGAVIEVADFSTIPYTKCYSTAMAAITLEVSMHYLPAYQR